VKPSASRDSLADVALALHPGRAGWVAAIGDCDGFRRPLWLDLSKTNWAQLLRRYALDQGGVRLSLSTYRTPTSRRASNVRSARVVMADLDGSQLWRFATPAPSIVVASGGQTDGKAHVHALWLLADSIDVAEVGKLCRGQADLLEGDSGFNAGATGSTRLPIDGSALLRFQPERSCRALELRRRHRPSVAAKTPKVVPAVDLPGAAVMAASNALGEVQRGASRNVTGWELAGELHRLGLSEEDAIESGKPYVEAVEDAKGIDHPYELSEWVAQVRRRFANGRRVVDRAHVERVNRWESSWLGDPSLSASQRTIVSAIAGRARATGLDRVTVSRRQLGLDARLASLPTIERALKGSKTRDGLLGKALKRDGRRKNGSKGAHRFLLVDPPPSPPYSSTTSPSSSVSCYRNAPPPLKVLPSSTVPLNHDGWSWSAIGHGPRLVFDQLASLDRPASVSELARHPALSNDRKTIRRQLRKLEAFNLSRRLSSGQWVVIADDLDDALEAAAELTERPGPDGKPERLSERLHRHHEAERIAYAKATDPVERKRKESDQLRRVCQRRKARREGGDRAPVRRRHSLPAPVELRQRREERALVRRHIHRPRVIRSGQAARPQFVLAEPPTDFTGVP
jgi:hypothetical protein